MINFENPKGEKGKGATENGGAIWNSGNLSISGSTFNSNSATNGKGGAIYNAGTLDSLSGDFVENNAAYGGAIYNDGRLTNSNSDFIENTASSGGAIYNYNVIETLVSDFVGNKAEVGGAIYNTGSVKNIKGDFVDNMALSSGGAIYNAGHMQYSAYYAFFVPAEIELSSDFINNSVQSAQNAVGGAISTYGEAYWNDNIYDDIGGTPSGLEYGTVDAEVLPYAKIGVILNEDGSVNIPVALRPYMGGKEKLIPNKK